MLDVLIITYQSEKWIEKCLQSLADCAHLPEQMSVYVVDNASTDRTIELLHAAKKQLASRFAHLNIERNNFNIGFGRANNQAAAMGRGEYLLCLNADTQVFPDTIEEILRAVERSGPEVGMWELRQFPYEHPKLYDPLTFTTSWCSGAAFVIRRGLFEKLQGFDEHLFMYGEDVELSWRARTEGYVLHYVPHAAVKHFCYKTADEIKPTQYVYSRVNHLILRIKFGTFRDVFIGFAAFFFRVIRGTPISHGRRLMLREWLRTLPAYISALVWHCKNRKRIKAEHFRFVGWDYSFMRDGAFFENWRPKTDKKVSILIRTCGRPDTLRETLQSVAVQTYPNLEIVVVEDGPDTSSAMIGAEFPNLPIVYQATGKRIGRCAAGNLALQLATGDYFNFLDDDDIFFADHVETLVAEFERNPLYKVAYALAFDTPIRVLSQHPYRYEVCEYRKTVHESFNRLRLLHHNLFPIQAVMFAREVYEKLGGFDERLGVLEDWNLWVRYASQYAFRYVEKTTSIYRVPADAKVNQKRQMELDEALQAVRSKHRGYLHSWTMEEIQHDCLEIMEQSSKARRMRESIKARLVELL